jgi:hypothetical protein
VLAALLLGAGAAPHIDVTQYPSPRVVLTVDASGGVLWWDATIWVQRMLDESAPRITALHALEYEALKLFFTRASELPPGVTHMRVVVVFAQTGLISGPYSTRPDAGVRTLLTVEGRVRPRATLPSTWEAQAQRGIFPPGVRVTPASDLGIINGNGSR